MITKRTVPHYNDCHYSECCAFSCYKLRTIGTCTCMPTDLVWAKCQAWLVSFLFHILSLGKASSDEPTRPHDYFWPRLTSIKLVLPYGNCAQKTFKFPSRQHTRRNQYAIYHPFLYAATMIPKSLDQSLQTTIKAAARL